MNELGGGGGGTFAVKTLQSRVDRKNYNLFTVIDWPIYATGSGNCDMKYMLLYVYVFIMHVCNLASACTVLFIK